MKMIINVPHTDWIQVNVSGDKQITNQGSVPIRAAQQAAKPTNDNDGEIISTYAQAYASVIVDGEELVWVKGIGGNSVISVQQL